ncbi:unnamed protein product [Rotaria sp. Silwood1]|nr:unnamed protein product [Rotaria sp. Silwood1]
MAKSTKTKVQNLSSSTTNFLRSSAWSIDSSSTTSIPVYSTENKATTKDDDDDDSSNNIKGSFLWLTCCECCLVGLLLGGIVLAVILTLWLRSGSGSLTTISSASTTTESTNTTLSTTNVNTTTTSITTTTVSTTTTSATTTTVSTTTTSITTTTVSTTTTSIRTTTVSTTTTSATTTVSTSTSSVVSVSSSLTNWYGDEKIIINCLTTLTNITIQIIVQKTVGAAYNGHTNSFASGVVSSSYVDNGSQIIYTWTIASGQNITCSSSSYNVKAQFSLVGTQQISSADTYVVTTTTSVGITTTYSGHF